MSELEIATTEDVPDLTRRGRLLSKGFIWARIAVLSAIGGLFYYVHSWWAPEQYRQIDALQNAEQQKYIILDRADREQQRQREAAWDASWAASHPGTSGATKSASVPYSQSSAGVDALEGVLRNHSEVPSSRRDRDTKPTADQ